MRESPPPAGFSHHAVKCLATLVAWGAMMTASSVSAASPDAGEQSMVLLQAPVFSQAKSPMPEHRRRRRLQVSVDEDEVPVHSGYGTHYSFVYVGTPPQRVSVILDTGSHLTAFPCTGCRECGPSHTDQYFSPTSSSTYEAVNCTECVHSPAATLACHGNRGCPISLSYVEGSHWDAMEARDLVYVGGDRASPPPSKHPSMAMPFVFGCQTYETGLFRTQLENGIMGLANLDNTIVPQLKGHKKISHSIFSLCFTLDGGSFTLGGYDERQHRGAISYVPVSKSDGFYNVRLRDVRVGNTSLGFKEEEYNKPSSTIVDSGTTDTSLPLIMQGAFLKAFKAATNHRLTYSTTKAIGSLTTPFGPDSSLLPDIVFVFSNGVEQRMPPSSYLDCPPQSAVKGFCTGGLVFESGSGVVLGANFMRDKDVIFDMEQKRVGFAPAVCSDGSEPDPSPTGSSTSLQQVPVSAVQKVEGGGRKLRGPTTDRI